MDKHWLKVIWIRASLLYKAARRNGAVALETFGHIYAIFRIHDITKQKTQKMFKALPFRWNKVSIHRRNRFTEVRLWKWCIVPTWMISLKIIMLDNTNGCSYVGDSVFHVVYNSVLCKARICPGLEWCPEQIPWEELVPQELLELVSRVLYFVLLILTLICNLRL